MSAATFLTFSTLVATTTLQTSNAASVRSFPRYDYGGKSHKEFLQDAIERSSPGNARLLTELFGGFELNLDISDGARAVISVGGAATKCQHQSPCFDSRCNACYDPLLRIHGICGGASYYTCRGTLPRVCLPLICTYKGGKSRSTHSETPEHAVFVKKFSRFQDQFCLGVEEKPRSLNVDSDNITELVSESTEAGLEHPSWVMELPDAVTPCQGYDLCLDLNCGSCYDSYLGIHTTCGKMSYFDCTASLPDECQPLKCTEANINEIFPMGKMNQTEEAEAREMSPLMVRNFAPLKEGQKNCI